jgi:hypothetical protein
MAALVNMGPAVSEIEDFVANRASQQIVPASFCHQNEMSPAGGSFWE